MSKFWWSKKISLAQGIPKEKNQTCGIFGNVGNLENWKIKMLRSPKYENIRNVASNQTYFFKIDGPVDEYLFDCLCPQVDRDVPTCFCKTRV